MPCQCNGSRYCKMRSLAVRIVSLFALIALIGWEAWKAGDMLFQLKGQIVGNDLQKRYAKISEELQADSMMQLPQADDIENALIQRTRKQTLVSHCHKRNRSGIYPAGQNAKTGLNRQAFRNIFVSDKTQLLYCMIPKVACSNWRRVLMVLEGYADDPYAIDSADVHNNTFGLLRPLSDYSSDEIIFRLSTYYKFLFVRNPLERFTSAYRNKFVESHGPTMFKSLVGKYILRRYRPDIPDTQAKTGEGVTFKDFTNYVIDSPPEDPGYYDRHWERYDRLCLPCLIYYDFIGKFETINEDADYLLRLLDVKSKVSFPGLKSNHRVPTKALSNFYYRTLGSKLQEKLLTLFEHDYELFGYKRPVIIEDGKKR